MHCFRKKKVNLKFSRLIKVSFFYFKQNGPMDYLRFVNNKETKFSLKFLPEQNHDFKVIQKSFDNTKNWHTRRLYDSYQTSATIKNIYRVQRKDPKAEDVGGSSILVFHGTPSKNVGGILQKGFRESRGGRFGKGVYHSNFFAKCSNYAAPLDNNDADVSF